MRPVPTDTTVREPVHLAVALPEGYQFVSRDRLPLGGAQPGVDIAPDGSRIAFVAGNQVKRIDATGERVTTMAELANTFGLSWDGSDALFVAAREANELVRIDVQRNASETVGSVRGDEGYTWAWAVPGGEAVLVNHTSIVKSDETEADPIFLVNLDGSRRVRVGIDGTGPQLFGDDILLAVRDGSLVAAPFDLADPAAVRTTRTVLEGLLVESTVGQWAVSPGGTLVHVPGRWLAGKSLVFDDGRGNVTDLGFPALPYGDFRLSPDGERLAITVGGADAAVWIYGIAVVNPPR